uniref:Uncharacterized protein n=1 Tax=Rhizophora mucronata TaxID=61149 RepID=A0A2P2QJ85_RHIMU
MVIARYLSILRRTPLKHFGNRRK